MTDWWQLSSVFFSGSFHNIEAVQNGIFEEEEKHWEIYILHSFSTRCDQLQQNPEQVGKLKIEN